jgi:hypothetical protein
MLEYSFADKIDELLKLVGDEQQTDESEADVENLADLVNKERARLVLFNLCLLAIECEDKKGDLFIFLLSLASLDLVPECLKDSFFLTRNSSELFSTPIVRPDRNLARPIEPFLLLSLLRFLDIEGLRSRRNERIILFLQ